jgi:hypothetical protein
LLLLLLLLNLLLPFSKTKTHTDPSPRRSWEALILPRRIAWGATKAALTKVKPAVAMRVRILMTTQVLTKSPNALFK